MASGIAPLVKEWVFTGLEIKGYIPNKQNVRRTLKLKLVNFISGE